MCEVWYRHLCYIKTLQIHFRSIHVGTLSSIMLNYGGTCEWNAKCIQMTSKWGFNFQSDQHLDKTKKKKWNQQLWEQYSKHCSSNMRRNKNSKSEYLMWTMLKLEFTDIVGVVKNTTLCNCHILQQYDKKMPLISNWIGLHSMHPNQVNTLDTEQVRKILHT